MIREEVLDRVRKLFALGESDNPHEAALAVGRAQALMERHAIASAEVDGGGDDEIVELSFCFNFQQGTTWKCYLADVVSKANGCFAVGRGSSIVIAGRKEDVAAAVRMQDYCHAEIDRLTARFAAGMGEPWTASFRIGCVQAIYDQVLKERAAVAESMKGKVSEAALVVVDDRSDRARESFGPIHLEKAAPFDVRMEAAAMGMVAGRGIFVGTKGRIES